LLPEHRYETLKKYTNKIKGSLLLALFLFFFASTIFFNHTHIIDGVTIVHSHPYRHTGNGLPHHNHSTNGFILINFLASFTAIAPIILASVLLLFHYIPVLSEGNDISFKNKSFQYSQLFRGPPLIIIWAFSI
jgi:hypothetical protein